METISFIITNINTKKYLEWCYNSIRKNLGYFHEIILLDDGSNDGSWEWMEEIHKKDHNTKIHKNPKNIGIAYSYNKAVSLASNDVVCTLHTDMYIPPKFDEIMLKTMEKYDFVTSFRAEPAIYPSSEDKAQVEFGRKLSEFDEHGFLKWSEENTEKNKDKGWVRSCFPWMIRKSLYEKIGGNDPLFLKYMVDDDDFYLRLKMAGAKMWQTFETAVYHMCSRSTKFKDDIVTDKGSRDWNEQHLKSTRNFVRKWGTLQGLVYSNTDEGVEMKSPKKYDIGFVVKNCNEQVLNFLEPWCSSIYIEDRELMMRYQKTEQVKTLYDMIDRVKPMSREKNHDILVEFNANDLSEERAGFLQNLPLVLSDSAEIGTMSYDIFLLTIKSLDTYEKDNIECKQPFKIYA
jgi:GT2 family glycosyltransferase